VLSPGAPPPGRGDWPWGLWVGWAGSAVVDGRGNEQKGNDVTCVTQDFVGSASASSGPRNRDPTWHEKWGNYPLFTWVSPRPVGAGIMGVLRLFPPSRPPPRAAVHSSSAASAIFSSTQFVPSCLVACLPACPCFWVDVRFSFTASACGLGALVADPRRPSRDQQN